MEVYSAKLKHLDSYERFLANCYQHGLSQYESAVKQPLEFLKKVVSNEGQTSTYFCIEHGEIIGAIRFRHFDSDYVENVIGHVGYETKPTARRKGVAKFMLSWIQNEIMEYNAIITCEFNNAASEKVILSCGGTYLNEVYSTEKQSYVKRYELPCT